VNQNGVDPVPVHPAYPPETGQGAALLRDQVVPLPLGLGDSRKLQQMAVEHQAELLGLRRLRPFTFELLPQPGLLDLGNQIGDGGQGEFPFVVGVLYLSI
jgi:hypothetical protein